MKKHKEQEGQSIRPFRAFVTQFVRFGIIGAMNTLLSLGIIYGIIWFWPQAYLLGNAVAWVLTVFLSYVLNRRFVFSAFRQAFWRGAAKCYLSYSAGLVISSLLLLFWVEGIGLSKTVAPIINVILMVPVNFLFARLFTFRGRGE